MFWKIRKLVRWRLCWCTIEFLFEFSLEALCAFLTLWLKVAQCIQSFFSNNLTLSGSMAWPNWSETCIVPTHRQHQSILWRHGHSTYSTPWSVSLPKNRGPKGRGNKILTFTWKPYFVSPSLCDLCTATLLKLGCWNFRQSFPKLVSKWNVFLYR